MSRVAAMCTNQRLQCEFEGVMRSDAPESYGGGLSSSQTPPAGRSRSVAIGSSCFASNWFARTIPSVSRVAFSFGLLACFALQTLSASTNAVPGGLTVQRSMRAAPHRLIVHPNGATVAAGQTQQFAVTDAQGKPVSVRWNVSGIGCSGSSCGSIDEHGVYQPPSSLPEPGIVTVEGVLVSDPNYSVLTEVRLEPAVNAAAAPAAQSSVTSSAVPANPVTANRLAKTVLAKTPPLAAPLIERKPVSTAAKMPAPNVVTAAPEIQTRSVSHGGNFPAVPSAIDAAPQVERASIARPQNVPPLPNAVAATPVIATQNVARVADLPPVRVVAAPPLLEKQNLSVAKNLPPVPNAVAAVAVQVSPPAVEKQNARAVEPPPVKTVAAAPVPVTKKAENPLVLAARVPAPAVPPAKVSSTPASISASLVVGGQPATSSKAKALTQGTIVQSRQVSESRVAESTPAPAKNSRPELVASVNPTTIQIFPGNTQKLTPGAARKIVPGNATPGSPVSNDTVSSNTVSSNTVSSSPATRNQILPQMQEVSAGVAPASPAPQASATSNQHPFGVTYSNGQLRIDAENVTLAAVLNLVAEKTGAVIEVPPGTGTERVFEHIGPGRPEDVLASLLNGSPFDFVIVGSPQGPHSPTQVLLSMRGAVAATPAPTLVATDQGAGEAKPHGYLWTPPGSSSPANASTSLLWTPPGASPTDLPPIVPTPPAVEKPSELTPDAREQMMKSYMRQLHGLPPQQ